MYAWEWGRRGQPRRWCAGGGWFGTGFCGYNQSAVNAPLRPVRMAVAKPLDSESVGRSTGEPGHIPIVHRGARTGDFRPVTPMEVVPMRDVVSVDSIPQPPGESYAACARRRRRETRGRGRRGQFSPGCLCLSLQLGLKYEEHPTRAQGRLPQSSVWRKSVMTRDASQADCAGYRGIISKL